MPLTFQEKMRRASSDCMIDCESPSSSADLWVALLDTGSDSLVEDLSPVEGKIRLLFVGGGLMERLIAGRWGG